MYNSRAAAVFPAYMEGEMISGNVELKIGRSMEIQEILISVCIIELPACLRMERTYK